MIDGVSVLLVTGVRATLRTYGVLGPVALVLGLALHGWTVLRR